MTQACYETTSINNPSLPIWALEMPWRCAYCGKTKTAKDFPASAKKCRTCISKDALNKNHEAGRSNSMKIAKETTSYLGVYIAERVLSRFFNHIERMPYGNPGYDFICGKGYKIDVKSSCIHNGHGAMGWIFTINRNRVADYFLCLAFDNRENLTPMHVWLIPGTVVNNKKSAWITNSAIALDKYSKYEHPTDKVIACCDEMRSEEEVREAIEKSRAARFEHGEVPS